MIEYVASCCILTSHIYLYDWKTLLQDEQVVYILSLPSVRICLYLIWFENPATITFKSIHNHWKPQDYVGLSLRNINQLLHNQFSLWLRFSYLCLRTFIKEFNRFSASSYLQVQSNRSRHLSYRYQNLSIKLSFKYLNKSNKRYFVP